MRFSTRSIVALLFMSAAVLSEAQQSPQVLRGHVPSAVSLGEAALVGRLPSAQELDLSIILPLRNQAELDGLLAELYDPSSPSFHRFLTAAQFTERFGPTVEDYRSVAYFAEANGCAVTDGPSNRLIVPIRCTA